MISDCKQTPCRKEGPCFASAISLAPKFAASGRPVDHYTALPHRLQVEHGIRGVVTAARSGLPATDGLSGSESPWERAL